MCPEHQKPLRDGKFGKFCPTLITTTPQGKKIWCDFHPESEESPMGLKSPTSTQNQPISEPLDVWGQPARTPLREPIREAIPQNTEDQKVKGMVRHGIVCALIQKRGLEPITKIDVELLEGWEEYIMTGKVAKFPNPYPKTNEDLSPDEMTRILEETD